MKKYIEDSELNKYISKYAPKEINIKAFLVESRKLSYIGKCIKTSDLLKKFSNCDIIILINKNFWDTASEKEKQMVIEHEIAHIDYDSKTNKIKIKKHDVEEFIEIIKKYGEEILPLKELLKNGKNNDYQNKSK